MTIAIQVRLPDGVTRTIPIDDDIYRIGNGPLCEVQVPVNDNHVLTVYRKSGHVYVVNRIRDTIRVGSEFITQRQPAIWQPGTRIIVQRIQFRLVSTRGEQSVPENPSSTPVESVEPNRNKRQLLIIVASLLATCMMAASQWKVEPQNREPTPLDNAIHQLVEMQKNSAEGGEVVWRSALLHRLSRHRLATVQSDNTAASLALSEARLICRGVAGSRNVPAADREIATTIEAILRDNDSAGYTGRGRS